MPVLEIHTQDPINSYNTKPTSSTQPAITSPSSVEKYPIASPGAAAPTPTSSISPFSQRGAAAVPSPRVTAKPSLPPPPKAGETIQPPEHYGPARSATFLPGHPEWGPTKRTEDPLNLASNSIAPESTTSSKMSPSFSTSATSASLPTSTQNPARASLEHPPGYVQNPYASDMTPDQRRAHTQQEQEKDTTEMLSLPSMTGTRPNVDESLWDVAKGWAKGTGKQAGKLHAQIWETLDKFNGDE